MAVQLINIGNIANDGTGDDLREAFVKVNANFEELDLRDDEKTTGSNLGSLGEGIFANRVNYDLQFKKIVGGDNITLTAADNTITINSDLSGITQEAVDGDSYVTKEFTFDGRIRYSNVYDQVSDLPSAAAYHGMFVHVHSTGKAYYAHAGAWVELAQSSEVNNLAADLTPTLGGNLDAAGFNINSAGTIDAATVTGAFTGSLTGLVHGYDMRDWATWNEGWDFGSVSEDYTSAIQFIVANTAVDFGTFSVPAVGNVDLGTI